MLLIWTEDSHNVLKNLINEFCHTTMLVHSSTNITIALTCDALDTAIRTIMQQNDQEEMRLLSFFSCFLTGTHTVHMKKNYCPSTLQ